MTTRSELLETAQALVTQDRAEIYGDPIEVYGLAFQLFKLWRSKADPHLPPSDFGMMFLVFIKLARMAPNIKHVDNFVDAIGYLALLGEAVTEDDAAHEA